MAAMLSTGLLLHQLTRVRFSDFCTQSHENIFHAKSQFKLSHMDQDFFIMLLKNFHLD